jgi:hypothetical protein
MTILKLYPYLKILIIYPTSIEVRYIIETKPVYFTILNEQINSHSSRINGTPANKIPL